MIGNDVIDLSLAAVQSNWQRKGFLQKLFSEKEQGLILSSDKPGIAVWNLWSRKEASYKIFNRLTNVRAFNPLHFECHSLAADDLVAVQNNHYYTKTVVTTESVHTIAVTAIDNFDNIYHCHPSEITKTNGLPFYYDKILHREFAASVSHHGQFHECCFLKSDCFNVNWVGQGAMHGAFFSNFQ